jgi:Protein of unknown function, DUF547
VRQSIPRRGVALQTRGPRVPARAGYVDVTSPCRIPRFPGSNGAIHVRTADGVSGGRSKSGATRAAIRGGVGGLALFALLSLLPGPLHPTPLAALDPVADYGNLLARAVKEDGVDYKELEAGRAALDAYVAWLETTDVGAAAADRGAFWINAHNALVLRLMLDTRPAAVERAAFEGRTWKVAHRDTTIDGAQALAREAAGPLAHFALYRAARSSPPLSPVLARGGDLAEALNQQATAYLSDEKQNRFAYAQLEAELSMLFLWHRADFEPLQQFLADHLPREKEEVARSLRKVEWRISFRPYDWSLGEAGGGRRPTHPAWLALYAVVAAGLLVLGARAFRGLLRSPLPRAPSPP